MSERSIRTGRGLDLETDDSAVLVKVELPGNYWCEVVFRLSAAELARFRTSDGMEGVNDFLQCYMVPAVARIRTSLNGPNAPK